jgi:hypothetical protein
MKPNKGTIGSIAIAGFMWQGHMRGSCIQRLTEVNSACDAPYNERERGRISATAQPHEINLRNPWPL